MSTDDSGSDYEECGSSDETECELDNAGEDAGRDDDDSGFSFGADDIVLASYSFPIGGGKHGQRELPMWAAKIIFGIVAIIFAVIVGAVGYVIIFENG